MERTKPPLRQIASDAITVTVDGTEYHPHAGESVWLRPGSSSNAMRILMRLQGLQKASLTNDDAAEFGELLQEAATYIAGAIVRWDWTDINGDPMPPITPESALNLDIEEVTWLLSASVTGLSEAAAKNAESPSTGTSPDAEAQPVTSG